jgi:endonuclease G
MYDKEFYIIAGGIFRSGKKVGAVVSIPDSCWKIAVALDRGQGLEDAGEKTQVFAAMMPNINGIGVFDWSQYQTTVDAIEESTGYDFLSALPDSLEAVLEGK